VRIEDTLEDLRVRKRLAKTSSTNLKHVCTERGSVRLFRWDERKKLVCLFYLGSR
jgi:hypothetical protein